MQELSIPDSVNVALGKNMCNNCTNLKKIKVGKNVPSDSNTTTVFSGCENLQDVTLPMNRCATQAYFRNILGKASNVAPASVKKVTFTDGNGTTDISITNVLFTGCS